VAPALGVSEMSRSNCVKSIVCFASGSVRG
jgi:hypothetical protein